MGTERKEERRSAALSEIQLEVRDTPPPSSSRGTPQATMNHRKPIARLRLVCEVERHKHKLAASYLTNRYLFVLFLPALLLTTVSGVLAFTSTSDVLVDQERPRAGNVLTLVVGVLAFISAGVQAVSDQLNWKTRSEMHRSAAIDLRTLVDHRKFEEQPEPVSALAHADEALVEQILKTCEDKYEQVMQGCKSIIPDRVDQAYGMIERFIFDVLEKDIDVEGGDSVKIAFSEAIQVLNYLFFEMCRNKFHPPKPHEAVHKALLKFRRNRDYLTKHIRLIVHNKDDHQEDGLEEEDLDWSKEDGPPRRRRTTTTTNLPPPRPPEATTEPRGEENAKTNDDE